MGYSSRRVVNHSLAKGTERVMQQGVPGTITNTYTDTYRMGRVVSTELTDTVTDGAVEEVVEYGTRVSSVERSDRLVSVHSNGDGSGYLLFASGDTMTFSRTLVCSATAYSIGTRTASGRPTAVGNIAVDTSVFPYGTRMCLGIGLEPEVDLVALDGRPDGEGLLALWHGHRRRLRHGHQGQQDRPLVQDLFRGMRLGPAGLHRIRPGLTA